MTAPDEQLLKEARELTGRIRRLALRADFPALLEIDAAPATAPLLELLGNDLAAAAGVHLEAARRWRDRQEAANRRRMDEAQAALDGFDVPLARALLGRVDDRWLAPEDRPRRDTLLLATEARAIEAEELAGAAEQAISEHRPRRWWRRRRMN